MRRKKINHPYVSRKSYRRGRRARQFLTILALVLAVSGAIFLTHAKMSAPRTAVPEKESDAADAAGEKELAGTASLGEKPEIPVQPEETDGEKSQPETEGTNADEGASRTGETDAAGCDALVPASGAVDLNYFDDAVFIGDSRTEGLFINTGLSNATFLTHQGLTVDEVYTKKVVNFNGQKTTVMDALSRVSFQKVYIMLGINETGWVYDNIFIEKYGEIIDGIRAINPDAVIYVQSILPVTNEVSATHDYIRNEKIDTYNQLLQDMAEEKGVYYLNVAEAVADSDGSLPESAAADGIHLKKEPCQVWLTYLREHTVQ